MVRKTNSIQHAERLALGEQVQMPKRRHVHHLAAIGIGFVTIFHMGEKAMVFVEAMSASKTAAGLIGIIEH